jgi:hypothetical protein
LNLEVERRIHSLPTGSWCHNKGVGFRSHSSGSGGSSGGNDPDAATGVFHCRRLHRAVPCHRRRRKEETGRRPRFYFQPRQRSLHKLNKTLKLLEFISKVDPAVAPRKLEEVAEAAFLQLQRCWQGRQYDPMKSLLMPGLYADHVAQLAGMIRNHEINIIDGLDIRQIDIVNVRYTHKPGDREFTALITALLRDYYIDDRTRKFLRGDTIAGPDPGVLDVPADAGQVAAARDRAGRASLTR